MPIYKRKASNGDIRYRSRIRINGCDRSKTFRTKREAELWEAKVRTVIESSFGGNPLSASKILTSNLLDEYRENELPKLRDRQHRQTQLDFWQRSIGHKRLADLSSIDFIRARETLVVGHFQRGAEKQFKRSSKTVNRYLACISAVMSYGVRLGWIPSSPVPPKLKLKEVAYEKRTLSTQECGQLLAHLEDCPDKALHAFIRISMMTGCRRGELSLLEWDCVSFESNGITFRASTTKTAKERIVYPDPVSMKLLSHLFERSTGPLVFPSPHDSSKPRTDFLKGFRQQLSQAGIANPQRIRIHDLRHTAGTLLAQQGYSLINIQKLLGHTSIQTTMKYVEASDKEPQVATQLLFDLLDTRRPA